MQGNLGLIKKKFNTQVFGLRRTELEYEFGVVGIGPFRLWTREKPYFYHGLWK